MKKFYECRQGNIALKHVMYSALISIMFFAGMLLAGCSDSGSADTTGKDTVAAPQFSPGAGVYTSAQNVVITCATSGAAIYYTTDGSDPGETAGTVYSSGITISADCTLKAIALKSGMNSSQIAAADYDINDSAVNSDFNISAGIFVVGGYQATTSKASSGTTAVNVACLWKITEENIEKKELADNAVVNAMILYKGSIYAAGALVDAGTGDKSACYWIVDQDGDITQKELDGVEATSVTANMILDNDIVYFGGYYLYNNTVKSACWWELSSGTATRYDLLEDERQLSYSTDIKVADDVIYASGAYTYDESTAASMWRQFGDSGMRKRLINDISGDETTSIFVADPGDYDNEFIYMAGYRDSSGLRGSYWKYSLKTGVMIRTDLTALADTNASKANSIFVDGETVYTAGMYNDYPCFWTGTVLTDIEASAGEARYIYIKDGSVCTAGYYKDSATGTAVACFWAIDAAVSGLIVKKDLTDTSKTNGYACSIIGVE